MADHNRHPMPGGHGSGMHKPGSSQGMQQLQGQGQTYTFQGQHPQSISMQQNQLLRGQTNTVYSTSVPNVRGGSKPDLPGSQVYGQQAAQVRPPHQRYYQVPQAVPPPFASPPRKGAERIRPAANHQKKQCNCKNSRCLKLYCECFASGRYCDSCNCVNCFNNRDNEEIRHSAVEAILERNPNAFRPKIQGTEHESSSQQLRGAAADGAIPRHTKGCNCKKSTCLKKYCECFQASIYCSDNCKCIDCKNFEGSEARSLVLAAQETAANSLLLTSPMKRSRLSAAAQQPQQIGMSSSFPLPTSHHAPSQLSAMQVVQQPVTHTLPQHPSLPSVHGLQHMAHASPQHQTIHSVSAPPPRPPAAAPSAPPAPIPNPRLGMQEVVSEVVKPEVIHELCRLLILVADDEAVKVKAAAQQAMAADGTTSAEGSVDPVELTRRSIEAQERVVMEEFLSVLHKILDTSNKKGGAEQPPQPQQQLQVIQPAGVSSAPLHLPGSKPTYGHVPFSPNAQSFGTYQLTPGPLLPAREPPTLSQPTLPDPSKPSFPNPFNAVASLPATLSSKAPTPPASLLPGALGQLAAHLQSYAYSPATAGGTDPLLHLQGDIKGPNPATSAGEASQSLPIDQLSIPYSLPEQVQKDAVQLQVKQQQQQQDLATLLSRVASQVAGGDAIAAAAVAAAAAAAVGHPQTAAAAAAEAEAMQVDGSRANGVGGEQQQQLTTEDRQ